MSIDKRKPGSNKDLKFKIDAKQPDQMNTGSMIGGLRSSLTMFDEPLEKAVKPQIVKKDLQNKYGQTKVVFGSRDYTQTTDDVLVKGYRRLSDSEQREIAQVDPYISAIIANRCAQGAVIGYESESKFDKGVRIVDLDPPDQYDFDSTDSYEKECAIVESQQRAIMGWVLNCGTVNQDVINAIYAGQDLTFKKCSLRNFIEAQVRNLLTFGRCATEVIYNEEDGVPVIFRPAVVETIAPVQFGKSTHVGVGQDVAEQSQEDLEIYNEIDPDERPLAYVQRIDGKNVNFYTEDDMHIWCWQKQALFDLSGYPLSPIEQAIYMVYVHQQTLTYLRNQFIKGMGNKGMITMESTQAGVEISEADMENFRQQFHNFVTRNDNSAVVPVVGGPIKVDYIPLSSTPRDMEFLQVEEHVIRALCSAFQISPQELGYGHLSLPQGGLSMSNKQEDIIKGEERGLRMLLDIIFDGINDIIYLNFPEAKGKFRVSYVGVGEDTREAVISRQQNELNTTATMNSLFSDSEKKYVIELGGDVPLSSVFHANVVKYMKYGEVRQFLFGDEGAAKNPAFDFIVDPNLNMAYQQLKVQPIQMQQQQAGLEMEQQKLGLQQMEGQMQMEQQQAQQMAAMGAQQPAEEGQQPAEEGQQPLQQSEGADKSLSLRDKWIERQNLRKSMSTYFSAWTDIHQKD